MVCSCSVHVVDVAALIHIVRSGRAATFNDCIHMHLVPYLKSKITPSANDEMNKITLPSRHRIRNSSLGGLRPSTLHLSHGGSSVLHNTYEWAGKKALLFETWMPERGTNPRSPEFSSRPLYNHCISPALPKLLQLGVHQFQREISKNVCPEINEKKMTLCCSTEHGPC